jgi:hypothetical protein
MRAFRTGLSLAVLDLSTLAKAGGRADLDREEHAWKGGKVVQFPSI